jgi:hypothetical protein
LARKDRHQRTSLDQGTSKGERTYDRIPLAHTRAATEFDRALALALARLMIRFSPAFPPGCPFLHDGLAVVTSGALARLSMPPEAIKKPCGLEASAWKPTLSVESALLGVANPTSSGTPRTAARWKVSAPLEALVKAPGRAPARPGAYERQREGASIVPSAHLPGQDKGFLAVFRSSIEPSWRGTRTEREEPF